VDSLLLSIKQDLVVLKLKGTNKFLTNLDGLRKIRCYEKNSNIIVVGRLTIRN
jgi:hypothetical protein